MPSIRLLRALLVFSTATLGICAEEHGESASKEKGGESAVMTQDSQDLLSPTQAFERLEAGNRRFREGKMLERNLVAQRKATSHGQYPIACILSCMDSRVSSEIIFDQGLGDIFNVRIAGNIVNDDVLGSLEYGHKVAGAKLLVVLGHSSCGAVKGAADDVVLGNITGLVAKIRPAVAAIPPDGKPRNSRNHPFIDKVARMNVIYTVRMIRERSPILRELQDRGKIDILGAFYDLETGKVEFYRPLSGASAQPGKKAEAARKEEKEESSADSEEKADKHEASEKQEAGEKSEAAEKHEGSEPQKTEEKHAATPEKDSHEEHASKTDEEPASEKESAKPHEARKGHESATSEDSETPQAHEPEPAHTH